MKIDIGFYSHCIWYYLALSRIEFLLLPCVVLSLLLNHEFSLMEIFWTLSIYRIYRYYFEGEPGSCKMLPLS